MLSRKAIRQSSQDLSSVKGKGRLALQQGHSSSGGAARLVVPVHEPTSPAIDKEMHDLMQVCVQDLLLAPFPIS